MTFLPGLASTKNHRALPLLASRSEDRRYELLSPDKGYDIRSGSRLTRRICAGRQLGRWRRRPRSDGFRPDRVTLL
jgi:hypothetical protein